MSQLQSSQATPRSLIHFCVAESNLTATIGYTTESTLGSLVKVCRKVLPTPSLLGILNTPHCADLESQYDHRDRLVDIGFEGDVRVTCVPPGLAKFTAPLPFIELMTPDNVHRALTPKKASFAPVAWTPVEYVPIQPSASLSPSAAPPASSSMAPPDALAMSPPSMANYRVYIGQRRNPEFIGIGDSNWLWIHSNFAECASTALLQLAIVVAHSPVHPPCIFDMNCVHSVTYADNTISYTWEEPIRAYEVLPGLLVRAVPADTELVVHVYHEEHLVLMAVVPLGSIKLSDLKCHIAGIFCYPTVLVSASHRSQAPGNWLAGGRPEARFPLYQDAQGSAFCRIPYCVNNVQFDMDVFAVPLWDSPSDH